MPSMVVFSRCARHEVEHGGSLEWLRSRSEEVRQSQYFQEKLKEEELAKEIRDKVFALTTDEVA